MGYTPVVTPCGIMGYMIGNAVTVANGKGGVGKTTLVANTAGVLAASGWQTLVVDLDRQGNLQRDLGYRDAAENDAGAALRAALLERAPLSPSLRGVGGRSGLDVVCGGRLLDGVAEACRPGAVEEALAPLAGEYHLVVVDCPGGGPMLRWALRAVSGVLIPVRADDGSLEGLEVVAQEYQRALAHNPALTVLGVVGFALPTRATRIRARLRRELEEALGGLCPVFDTMVRDSARAAFDMRRHGELAYEYSALAAEGVKGRRFSSSAAGVANDYEQVAAELSARLREVSR